LFVRNNYKITLKLLSATTQNAGVQDLPTPGYVIITSAKKLFF